MNLNGWNDPKAELALQQLRIIFQAAKDLGLHTCLIAGNTQFRDTPKNLLATPLPDPTGKRGNSGFPLCPNIPEAKTLIHQNYRRLFKELSDIELDLICFWPYDEGGCACQKCYPWGSNGFLMISRELSRLAGKYFPKLKVILSTWLFDTPPEGEWEGLSRALAETDHWVDYIMADSHEDFPSYPLENGIPGKLPLLNFPEISMWGMWPWGGYGANPLPKRFQRLWNQAKHILAGGFAYSEGIYEDMNKVIISQFYWNGDRTAEETLREYIAYEYSPEVIEEVWRIVKQLEIFSKEVMLKRTPNTEEVHITHQLAQQVEAKLSDGAGRAWRWRLLYLRTLLNQKRLVGDGLETDEAQMALRELIEIYQAKLDDDGSDPYHHRVRPPLAAGSSPVEAQE